MKFFVFKYAVIAFVVFGQSLALSHSLESGGDAHHHDGVVCPVALYDGHFLDSASLGLGFPIRLRYKSSRFLEGHSISQRHAGDLEKNVSAPAEHDQYRRNLWWASDTAHRHQCFDPHQAAASILVILSLACGVASSLS